MKITKTIRTPRTTKAHHARMRHAGDVLRAAREARDKFEEEFYDILRGCGLTWTQMKRGQGYDNTVHGLYNLVVEVKNSNNYKLTATEIKKKEQVELVGGVYWIAYDRETTLAVADAARGLDVKMPFDR